MHSGVREGRLVHHASSHGLKTTILTSGDLLHRSNWKAMVDAGCYFRVSLNAASTETRRLIHGNHVNMGRLWRTLEEIITYSLEIDGPPVGGTFLLTDRNFHEVLDAAKRAKQIGVQHFSVRRVLGPEFLRPSFSEGETSRLRDLLREVAALTDDGFSAFVPFRDVHEPDLSPRSRDIQASSCWQSTFKAVMEPADLEHHVRVQLCGRYRGGGVGQVQQLDPVVAESEPHEWVSRWRSSFHDYPLTRNELIRHCSSCIDRGFIEMMDALVDFTDMGRRSFVVEHFMVARESDLTGVRKKLACL